jgi:hypothetical protein
MAPAAAPLREDDYRGESANVAAARERSTMEP